MRMLIYNLVFGLCAWVMGFYSHSILIEPSNSSVKTEQVDSLSSLPYTSVKEKGSLKLIDKDGSISVYEYKKGDRVYTVFTSEYDYVNAVREK